jgi:hypothetical protein
MVAAGGINDGIGLLRLLQQQFALIQIAQDRRDAKAGERFKLPPTTHQSTYRVPRIEESVCDRAANVASRASDEYVHACLLWMRSAYAGASIELVRTSFLFTNSWMPRLESSRP